jgi:hypothetical protein
VRQNSVISIMDAENNKELGDKEVVEGRVEGLLLTSKGGVKEERVRSTDLRWSFASPCLFVRLSARVSTPRGDGRRRDLRRRDEEYLAKVFGV